jgi:4-diphosphocytidyl-2-C-methyl-D-erythritol kinase
LGAWLADGEAVASCQRTWRERAVIARGIGDELSPAPALPKFSLLLANPRVPTATPDVFRGFTRANTAITPRDLPPLPLEWATMDALVADIRLRGNDLLPAALAVTPAIGKVLEALQSIRNAPYAGLSGSGATCFAILPDDDAAAEAGERLHHDHPGWWFWWPGKIIG